MRGGRPPKLIAGGIGPTSGAAIGSAGPGSGIGGIDESGGIGMPIDRDIGVPCGRAPIADACSDGVAACNCGVDNCGIGAAIAIAMTGIGIGIDM